MQDSEYYNEPEKFDGYRFLRMRETPGKDKMAHLVSTSELHLGFGHGQHACPGRFFAANEIKLILTQLLLNYDMKLPEDAQEDVRGRFPDPNREILFRRVTQESL